MVICGIEIAGKDIILVIGRADAGTLTVEPLKRSKLSIADGDDPEQLRSIKTTLEAVFRDHGVERVWIKARTAGKFKPGPVGYKLETLVLINDICGKVDVVHPNKVVAALKDVEINLPDSLNKYCEDAYRTAYALARKETAA